MSILNMIVSKATLNDIQYCGYNLLKHVDAFKLLSQQQPPSDSVKLRLSFLVNEIKGIHTDLANITKYMLARDHFPRDLERLQKLIYANLWRNQRYTVRPVAVWLRLNEHELRVLCDPAETQIEFGSLTCPAGASDEHNRLTEMLRNTKVRFGKMDAFKRMYKTMLKEMFDTINAHRMRQTRVLIVTAFLSGKEGAIFPPIAVTYPDFGNPSCHPFVLGPVPTTVALPVHELQRHRSVAKRKYDPAPMCETDVKKKKV